MPNPGYYMPNPSEPGVKLYNRKVTEDGAKQNFQQVVWDYYHENGRHTLPWRQPEASGEFDPYKIMISEVMLQQTQVSRVIDKYYEFLELFPTVDSLANAELGSVLRAWAGLGYNRRAKFLQQAAQMVSTDFGDTFPQDAYELTKLSGVGVNTAGAILAYAFNSPALFVETNIRTVYIHHFFENQENINDKEILNMLSNTLDRDNPREWYWALMDYGSHLKRSGLRRNHQSKHYSKQSKFEGSKRQIRGEVLRQLGESSQTLKQLSDKVQDDRLSSVIDDLLRESLIQKRGNSFRL